MGTADNTPGPAGVVAQALTEYGAAIRGDWSELDGRSVRNQLDTVASWLRFPDTAPDLNAMRNSLGICPGGDGHWPQYCGESYTTCTKEKS